MLLVTVIPEASPEATVRPETDNVSVVSTSVAPCRRSTVNAAPMSVTASVIAPETTGASFEPVIVIAISSVVPSIVWTAIVSVTASFKPSDCICARLLSAVYVQAPVPSIVSEP